MEVKIICHSIDNPNKQAKTFLFEGSDINHQFVQYESIANFKEVYNQNVQGKPGWVIGIPVVFWESKDSKELDIAGCFLLIYFNDENGDYKFVAVKDATIFITSKGQTIDRILVP